MPASICTRTKPSGEGCRRAGNDGGRGRWFILLWYVREHNGYGSVNMIRRAAPILAPAGPAGEVGIATCVHASYLGPVQDGHATGASPSGLLRPPLLLFLLPRALLHGGEEPEHCPAYVGNVLKRGHTPSEARRGMADEKKMSSPTHPS